MQIKTIQFKNLSDAIRIAFENDKDMFKLFDPNVKVETLDEIVSNIIDKIKTYGECEYVGIYDKNKLIGYFVYKGSQLISFALAVPYRQRKYLREFFRIIRTTITGHFMVLLWSKNIRAIKFLLKNEMQIINQNENITQLAY